MVSIFEDEMASRFGDALMILGLGAIAVFLLTIYLEEISSAVGKVKAWFSPSGAISRFRNKLTHKTAGH